MSLTTEQLLLIAGIALNIYPLIGGSGLALGKLSLPALTLFPRITLMVFGVALMSLGFSSQLLHAEFTYETPAIDNKRVDVCLFSGGYGCGYEAATTWCRSNGYKLASIWTVDPEVGHTEIIGTRSDCGSDQCSAFRTITCMR